MAERELTIVNRLGLHARAASKFVTLATRFRSKIRVRRGAKEANGKSIMGVMMLAAGRGTKIQVIAIGDDADAALDALQALVENRFGEAE